MRPADEVAPANCAGDSGGHAYGSRNRSGGHGEWHGRYAARRTLHVFRAASRLLSAAGISIVRSYVGNYATSLEMAGCSVTLMRLTSRLKPLLLAPAHSPALVQV